MTVEGGEQLQFNERPEIIKALDERAQLNLLHSFLSAQARDVKNRIVELDAYIGDSRMVYEHSLESHHPLQPMPYQPRVGGAKRIASTIAHTLNHTEMHFPTGLRKLLK